VAVPPPIVARVPHRVGIRMAAAPRPARVNRNPNAQLSVRPARGGRVARAVLSTV